jgi:hypothetical protein
MQVMVSFILILTLPTGQEAGWDPEPVWIRWPVEKSEIFLGLEL